jgi:protein-tyrosine phosphatase
MRFMFRFALIVILLLILLWQNWYALARSAPWVIGLLLWMTLAFALVGCSFKSIAIFGKQINGTMKLISCLILLPYLLFAWGVWWLKVIFAKEEIYHEIIPNLFLGRRPRNKKELPPNIEMVVDLTAEFAEDASVCQNRLYHCLPMCDGYIPECMTDFSKLIDEVATFSGRIYVHCAVGRGRSALVVAAVLLKRGVVQMPKEAHALMQEKRPVVRLNYEQLDYLVTYSQQVAKGEIHLA